MRVIVLDGNENQAVAAVRSLGRAGHIVLVGSESRWSKAGWSRSAAASFTYPSPQVDVESFVTRVVEEVRREPHTLVLPMTERTTLPLSARREEIYQSHGMMVLPPNETVLRAFDKRETTEIAKRVGVAVPRTTMLSSRAEVEEFCDSNSFPVVVKARSSEEISSDGRVLPTGAPAYAKNKEEFQKAFEHMTGQCSAVLVQEYVAGTGTGYFALMNKGELRAEFAHRRIRDVRPTGSGSAVRESIQPDSQVRNAALKILGDLKWHGVAMVEFRCRPDGPPVFLEVNGRFWNSLPLSIYAGVDFPALVAQMAEEGDVPLHRGYQAGVRCRWFLGDFRHLVEVWRGAPEGYAGDFPRRIRTLIDFLTPVRGTFHDNFSWHDPLPELGDWLDFFARRIPASFNKRRARLKELNVQSRYSLS